MEKKYYIAVDCEGVACAVGQSGAGLGNGENYRFACRQAAREAAAAAGKYDGNLPFRIELEEHQCRVYFGDGGQPSQIFDCRKFRSAVECDEIVWLTGKRGLGLPLPKEQLVDATPGQLRRWLRPYAAIWSMSHIPDKLKESIAQTEDKAG